MQAGCLRPLTERVFILAENLNAVMYNRTDTEPAGSLVLVGRRSRFVK